MIMYMEAIKKIKPALASLVLALILTSVEIYFGIKNLDSFLNFQYDDSFITFRYADQLVSGNGFRFNPSDNSNSASAPTYGFLIALAIFFKLGEVTLVSNFINSFSLFVINFLFSLAGYKLFQSYKGAFVGITVGALITSQGFLLYWTFSGMETTTYLATFALFLMIPAINTNKYWDEWTQKSKITFYISILLFSTFRLEASLIAFFAVIVLILSDRSLRNRPKSWFPLGTVAFAPIVMFFLFWQVYYGHFIPEPVRFKRLARAYNLELEQSLKNLSQFVLDHKIFFLIALFSVAWLIFISVKNRKVSPSNLFVLASLVAATGFLIESPNSDSYRYNLILFPPTAFLVLLAIQSFSITVDWKKVSKAISITIALFVLIMLIFSVRESRVNLEKAIINNQWWWYIQEGRTEAGKWLEANTPDGSIILSGDLGAISYYNPSNTYVDSGGLTNQKLIDAVESNGSYSDVITSRNPMYVVDTEKDGQTGSEGIFNNPQGFYLTKVYSNCKFNDIYEEQLLKRWPDSPAPSGLYVAIYKLTPLLNAKC